MARHFENLGKVNVLPARQLIDPCCCPSKTIVIFIEGSLEVKLVTIWTDGKAEVGRVREEKEPVERRSEKRKNQKKNAGVRRGRKVVTHCVFSMFCGSGRSKTRLPKAEGGAEPSKEKLHSVVARSAFEGQNAKISSALKHF